MRHEEGGVNVVVSAGVDTIDGAKVVVGITVGDGRGGGDDKRFTSGTTVTGSSVDVEGAPTHSNTADPIEDSSTTVDVAI